MFAGDYVPMADELVVCPYNNDHRVRAVHLVTHLKDCEKDYPDSGLVHCRYNYAHVISMEDLLVHEEHVCPHRPRNPTSSQDVGSYAPSEDWENEVGKCPKFALGNFEERYSETSHHYKPGKKKYSSGSDSDERGPGQKRIPGLHPSLQKKERGRRRLNVTSNKQSQSGSGDAGSKVSSLEVQAEILKSLSRGRGYGRSRPTSDRRDPPGGLQIKDLKTPPIDRMIKPDFKILQQFSFYTEEDPGSPKGPPTSSQVQPIQMASQSSLPVQEESPTYGCGDENQNLEADWDTNGGDFQSGATSDPTTNVFSVAAKINDLTGGESEEAQMAHALRESQVIYDISGGLSEEEQLNLILQMNPDDVTFEPDVRTDLPSVNPAVVNPHLQSWLEEPMHHQQVVEAARGAEDAKLERAVSLSMQGVCTSVGRGRGNKNEDQQFLEDIKKEKRKLGKKIKEIETLEKKKNAGEELNSAQMAKLGRKDSLLQQKNELESFME